MASPITDEVVRLAQERIALLEEHLRAAVRDKLRSVDGQVLSLALRAIAADS